MQSHPWKNLDSNHYSLANTELEFKTQMKAGLILPIVILSNSKLSLSITSQHVWSGLSLDTILDSIFEEEKSFIDIQDHGLASLKDFTVIKTSDMV